MKYFCTYQSPIGKIILISDGKFLLYLTINREIPKSLIENKDLEIFKKTRKWLDSYFSGLEPQEKLKIKLEGTAFQKEVWDILLEIPFGKTTTYGNIASKIAEKRGVDKMSAQAIGNAIHNNPIPIIVPCHRVVGSNSLGGYAFDIYLKKKLLTLENSCFLSQSY